jgi:hydrogenase/urease accessory protein HupE
MVRPLIVRLLAALITLCALALSSAAHAHLTPNTMVEIDADRDRLRLQIIVPEGEWAYAYGAETLASPNFARHIGITGTDGKPWALRDWQVKRVAVEGGPDLVATVTVSAPAGADPRRFTLRYSGVIDRVASHNVLVSLRSDFGGGVLASDPRLLGALQGERRALRVNLGETSRWQGFAATFASGVTHILEGYDHLLFLFALLLPAGLMANSGRWADPVAPRAAFVRLLTIITAFTIGHSLTLIGGAWFGWSLPVQPVEVAIALSVLVSAIHAAKPIFAGKEPWVAAGFGLIHGLAFATIIGEFTLPPTERATAILGFNLGIEAVQLGIAVLVFPALILASRQRWYRPVRLVLATGAGLAALFWVWERV